MRFRPFDAYRLYLVTDRGLCLGRDLLDVVFRSVEGGVSVVQLREKHADTREFLAIAKRLTAELQPRGIPVMINDRVDIALASGAAGVHLGQSDMPVADARAILGPDAIIGLSVESEGDIREGLALPVQYLAVSPVFGTPTKTDTARPWGLEGLARARSLCPGIPLVAIGGINEHTAGDAVRAGADSLAVVSAICSAPSPAEAARRIIKAGWGG